MRAWIALAAAIGRRPDLWRTATGAARSHAPAGWWRRRPWLPLPDRQWMDFRLTTAYGTSPSPYRPAHGAPQADELIEWLEWLRSWKQDVPSHDH